VNHFAPSRRELLTGLAALGASALLPAQTPAGDRRILDVHQHYVSPDYLALLTR